MVDETKKQETFKEKLLFYTTAFFVLLGIFSLFGFLFLVPFVIEPAFTTIFMEFDETPATCVTAEVQLYRGVSNCSWTSCREGCTREVYECTQIRVNYKRNKLSKMNNESTIDDIEVVELTTKKSTSKSSASISSKSQSNLPKIDRLQHFHEHRIRFDRSISDYNYADSESLTDESDHHNSVFPEYDENQNGLMDNTSEWFFIGARLFPNVKGCGYPPYLNCSIWTKKYKEIGSNYSCYYSRVDPSLVISDLDMKQNLLNLYYALFIPIPSFILAVIYLTFAYFKIYNEDEEEAPLGQNAEDIAGEDEIATIDDVEVIVPNGTATMSVASVPMSPSSEITSFGHQLKVKMADEMSRDSLDGVLLSNSGSIQG